MVDTSAAVGPTAEPCRSGPVHQLPAIRAKQLEHQAPGGGQGGVASRRVVPQDRLHRHQPGPSAERVVGVLQRSRHRRAAHQGGQERASSGRGCPAGRCATMRCGSSSMRSPTISPTSCGPWPWQRRSSPLVAHHPAREAGQDRRQDRAPRPLRRVPAGRGRGAARLVRRDPAPDRAPAAKTAAAPGVSIESNERRQPEGRGVSTIDREPLKGDRNAGRKPEQAVLRNHEARPGHSQANKRLIRLGFRALTVVAADAWCLKGEGMTIALATRPNRPLATSTYRRSVAFRPCGPLRKRGRDDRCRTALARATRTTPGVGARCPASQRVGRHTSCHGSDDGDS